MAHAVFAEKEMPAMVCACSFSVQPIHSLSLSDFRTEIHGYAHL
jgi:hypothetical protein